MSLFVWRDRVDESLLHFGTKQVNGCRSIFTLRDVDLACVVDGYNRAVLSELAPGDGCIEVDITVSPMVEELAKPF